MTVFVQRCFGRAIVLLVLLAAMAASTGAVRPLLAQALQPAQAAPAAAGGEASLVLPDLSTVDFVGINGRTLLMGGLFVCALGLLFGLATFTQLKTSRCTRRCWKYRSSFTKRARPI
jgi:K(+)-stimulated pyrophosphate-energized sodium pump